MSSSQNDLTWSRVPTSQTPIHTYPSVLVRETASVSIPIVRCRSQLIIEMYNYLIAGQKFAILELKSMITKVLKNFELELPEKDYEPVVVAELILRPEDGIRLKLKPRRKA